MSHAFRDLLRKVGSGAHTSKHLTRAEAAEATRLMLTQAATPAQIGAFMIAHRIKRPTGEELAGMLDAYNELGPTLHAGDRSVMLLNAPYDGRSRTAPVRVIVALILASAGCPVVMHGGDRMPTKYGIPLVDLWAGLGVNWRSLALAETQQVFDQTDIGVLYQPKHFPLAQGLVTYRDEIGKRPPFATVELMWSPVRASGQTQLAMGFVHPPTENMAKTALQLHQTRRFITVKGLEGSSDLPRDRTCIIGIHDVNAHPSVQRLLLHPREYGFDGTDVPLNETTLIDQLRSVIDGQPSELMRSVVWNAGFYLWQATACPSLTEGLDRAQTLLKDGAIAQQLTQLQTAVRATAPV
jgi:anthranilate phosphoribosyltransferase